MSTTLIIIGIIVVVAYQWLKFPREYERLVVFRLGRVIPKPRGPVLRLSFGPLSSP